jgi:NhaA family Na+:H+ antiporter
MNRVDATGLFQKFFNSEKAGGLILIGCTALSLALANSSAAEHYIHFWHFPAAIQIGRVQIPFRIEEWINDGLMTFFFYWSGLK